MNTSVYTETGVLYEEHRTRVVRAEGPNGERVVIKQLRTQWPTPSELSRLRREHDLLASLEGSGAPRVCAFDDSGVPQLITHDRGAVPLSSWLGEARSSAALCLEVALNLSKSLAAVHSCGVLHRDLNPTNCVVHPETHEVWLIDFDLASPIARRRARPQPLAHLEGTPAYLAPEQTGRMNRSVDARSDLYALGITLYELFSGRTPFVGDDVLAFAHAHLALEPPKLVPLVPGLPQEAIDLVETLLRKRPEDRYQSALGVVVDLEHIIAGDTGPQALRARTLATQLELPQGLYGRQEAVSRLLDSLGATGRGDVSVVLISGAAGIGKTALVHELYRPATVSGARLLKGKFDQFTRTIPYAALEQVFSAFVADVLSAPTEQVERWRSRILAATAPNAGLLTLLAPDLELLLGPQPPVPELGPSEGRRRLHETLRRALGAIASAQSPLVLFLDDLQWADLPTLRLLEALFRDPDLSHFMFVASWRSEEFDAEQLLGPTLQAIGESGARLENISLGSLEREDLASLFADALHRELEDVQPLVDALHVKTHGNPFFIHRLMEEAADAGAVFFDEANGSWQWDLERLQDIGPADNVVALLEMELSRVSGDTRSALAAAALLGEAFDLETLVMATGMSRSRLRKALKTAIDTRFIYPVDDGWWAVDTDLAPRFTFAFVHDRVQQAAQHLCTQEQCESYRLALARGLSGRSGGQAGVQSAPFQAAEHYAAVLRLVQEKSEREHASQILFEAGERALESAAFTPAHRFFEAAIDASDENLWSADPERARLLWSEGARAAWLVNAQDCFDAHIATLRAHARDIVDLLLAEEILVQATIARGDLHAALDAALSILSRAGIELARKPNGNDVGAAIGATMGVVGDRDVQGITDNICKEDVKESALRGLLVRIASAAYVAEPNLLPLIACELVQRTINMGATRESSYGFGVYSLCLSAGWLLEAGDAQGRVALALLDRFPDPSLDGPVRHVVHHFSRVWSDSLRQIHARNGDIYRSLMDAGDLEYAGWVLHMRVINGLFSAMPLEELSEEIEHAVRMMRLHDVQSALHCTLQFEQLVKGLVGESDEPATLNCESYDSADHMAQYVETDFRAAALTLSLCRQMAAVFFNDTSAVAATDDVMAFADGALAVFYQCPMRVYGAIALLDSNRDLEESLKTISEWRVPVAAAAAYSPDNSAHLLALMDAEVARAKDELPEAIRLYDQAIVKAGRARLVHDEALANERAARMHLSNGSERIAQAYLLDARHAFQRWGATAKVTQLDEQWPQLLSAAITREPAPRQARLTSSMEALSQQELDFDSVFKASQAIAEEVELESLLSRSMAILLESVGARRGVLLLSRRGELRVEVVADINRPPRLVAGAEFDESSVLALSIVRRVWRKHHAEVHDDARDGAVSDPYLQGDTPLSVLCAPATYRGRHLGVFYFENDLSAGVFTPGRVRVLEVLASQFAITFHNVRLQAAQSRFIPVQFIASLGHDDILDVEVGDHQSKQVSVFFSDIWGFTRLVEELDARDALALVNRYLSFAEPAITGSGGFIDTYLGDGIMALFDQPQQNAKQAVAAAIACHRTLDRFNLERSRAGLSELRTGIGIHTGVVTMGTIGGQHSLKCGVVGDAVNLASRVEGITRLTGSRVLISEQTLAEFQRSDYLLRRAGRVRVQGRQKPVTIYEVLDAELPSLIDARLATLERFESALDAYYDGRMAEAVGDLAGCLQQSPGDVLAGRFMALAQNRLVHGTPEDWDGIERLTEK